MARYDFKCYECQRIIEVHRPIGDSGPVICTMCEGLMDQYFGNTKLRFKAPVIEFFDKANELRFNNQKEMKEYERRTGSMLMSNEEISQEFKLQAKRAEEAEQKQTEQYFENNMRRILNAQ